MKVDEEEIFQDSEYSFTKYRSINLSTEYLKNYIDW
jgi:hypothetical protein